jgi:hypothetical protein
MASTALANSGPERSGVAKLKCLPALGSTAEKMLAVPHRLLLVVAFGDLAERGGHRRAHIGEPIEKVNIVRPLRLYSIVR